MQSFIVTVNVVMPLFIIIGVGMIIKKLGLTNPEMLRMIDAISFRTFLPALLFKNIYNTDLSAVFNIKFIGFGVACVFLSFALGMLVVTRLVKSNPKRGAIVQNMVRSNTVIFGLALTASFYGSGNNGAMSILTACTVIFTNALAVTQFEIFRGSNVNVKDIAKGIVRNPLIIASVLGLITLLLKIELPSLAVKAISDLGSVATPLCLVTLGASLDFSSFSANRKEIMIGTTSRLIVLPLIFIPLAILFGFRGPELASLAVLVAAPASASSFTLAQQMGGDNTLSAQLLVSTTLLSVVTVFGIFWMLTSMSLI